MKLNLGSGNDIKEGYINVDNVSQEGISLIIDLNEVPYDLERDSVEEIYASHILEHLDNPIKILKEWHRICKNKAKIIIRVPHFSSWANFADPTHKNRFSYFYMDYFTDTDFYQERIEKNMFKIVKRRINYLPSHLYSRINFLTYPIFNLFPKIYERFLYGILPSSEIYWELEVIK